MVSPGVETWCCSSGLIGFNVDDFATATRINLIFQPSVDFAFNPTHGTGTNLDGSRKLRVISRGTIRVAIELRVNGRTGQPKSFFDLPAAEDDGGGFSGDSHRCKP